VADDSNDDFIFVGVADDKDGQHWEASHLQRSLEFGGQDVALDLDQVYLERNDQSQGAYGGIQRVEMHLDRIRIAVSDRTTLRLGDGEFEIALSLAPEEFDRLCRGLRIVFKGFGSLTEYPAVPGGGHDGGDM
jgi:hypothetical protein